MSRAVRSEWRRAAARSSRAAAPQLQWLTAAAGGSGGPEPRPCHHRTGSELKPRKIQVVAPELRWLLLVQAQAGQPLEQHLEGDLQLTPGHARAQAVVRSEAEAQVLLLDVVAGDVEAVRLGELRRVAIGGAHPQEHQLALLDALTPKLEVLRGEVVDEGHRRAQRMISIHHGRLHVLGVLPQQLELVGVVEQLVDAVADLDPVTVRWPADSSRLIWATSSSSVIRKASSFWII